MRRAQQESIDLVNFYKNQGRSDAVELGFMKYEGGNVPMFESAYEKSFNDKIKEIIENEC